MIEAPLETRGVGVAHPVENAIGLFLDAFPEPVGGENGNKGERKDERADEREGHGVGHGMEEFSRGAREGVDGEVSGNDDGDGIKNGAVDVAGGSEDDVAEFVLLPFAQAELAINVLDHDDGAVNDDAEVDGADGEEVGGFAGGVQENKGKKQCQRNGEGGDHGGADAHKEKDENEKDENHTANEVPFHGLGGDADQVAAVVQGANLNVRGEDVAIEIRSLFLNALKNSLRLFTAAHEDDAF